jgi:protein-S-isoprenylcysteine O-methyltransferase Ste14
MRLKVLVGSGDKVMGLTLPFALIGIAANLAWPSAFRLGAESALLIVGIVLLVLGVPLWLTSVAQIIVNVPKKRLITSGPYRLMLHPLYTSVAILVIPGFGLMFDSWVGFAIGAVLYVSSRIFSVKEEEILAKYFPAEYPAYRAKVILPWL